MRSIILVLSFACLSLPATAQRNRITAHLYESSTSYEDFSDTLGMARSIIKNVEMHPALGYYRLIGENWGLGIEVSYAKVKFDNSNHEEAPDIGEITDAPDLRTQKEYYFSPTIFEQIDFDRYRFTSSLSIPVRHIFDIKEDAATIRSTKTDPDPFEITHTINGYPNQWIVGLSLNGGVQRQLFGGLYCGFDIGAGYNYTYAKGDRSTYRYAYSRNVMSSETFFKNNLKEQYTSFQFRAAITLSCYF